MTDHQRGCEGRTYTCTCGYDDQLVRIGPDAVERIAAAMAISQGAEAEDWEVWLPEATVAIAALKGEE
jgi:hypothetical protein